MQNWLKWLLFGLVAAAGIGLIVWWKTRGNDAEAKKIELDLVEGFHKLKIVEAERQLAKLDVQGKEESTKVQAAAQAVADAKAKAAKSFESRGASAAEVVQRFNRMSRPAGSSDTKPS